MGDKPYIEKKGEQVTLVDWTWSHSGVQWEKKFYRLFGNYIQKDLLRYCIYSNSLNDPAHQLGHVYDVCERAKEIFNHFQDIEDLTDLDRAIVYHAALMHDLGCRYNRKDHHLIGYGLVYELINRYDPNNFSVDHLRQIAVCVLEHRSSSKKKPSSVLSEIVAIADTGVPDIRLYLKRSLQFRLSGLDGTYNTDEELFDGCYQHVVEKFGDEGYQWKSYPDIGLSYYAEEWDVFKEILKDKDRCLDILKSIKLELDNKKK